MGVTDISTRVLIPLIIKLIIIFTITTTEEFTNDIARLHGHICGRYRSSITTAIYLLDAGSTTTFNDNLCILLLRVVGVVNSQVTTAIDSFYIIVIRIIFSVHRYIDSLGSSKYCLFLCIC